MNRLLKNLSERMAMSAFSNVISGRRTKWYTLSWVGSLLTKLIWIGLLLFTLFVKIFYYVVVPLLVVCMFIQVSQMNNQLDRIEATQNSRSETEIIMEWIHEKIEESENRKIE